eukprot:2831634-Prymnesium_polylepis.1
MAGRARLRGRPTRAAAPLAPLAPSRQPRPRRSPAVDHLRRCAPLRGGPHATTAARRAATYL